MAGGPRAEASASAPASLVGLAPRTRQLLSDYVELTKPKVQSLLLLTTFLIQHVIGLDGMPRRVYEYEDVGHLQVYNLISTVGAFILAAGVVTTIVNVARSLKTGVIAGPDPWKANTLEWFTTSPPPVNNFDVIPRVRSVEPMRDIRRQIERQTGVTQKTGGSEQFARA